MNFRDIGSGSSDHIIPDHDYCRLHEEEVDEDLVSQYSEDSSSSFEGLH